MVVAISAGRRFDMTKRILVLVAALLVAGTVMTSSGNAQGPLHKQVRFSINVPYRLRMGHYMLPPGNYTLYQISANDLNLFLLYQGGLNHTPIAAIRTVRIDHAHNNGYVNHTEMRWRIDEDRRGNEAPVITGFEIPGEDGWQIISVVQRSGGRKVMQRVARY